MIPTTRASLSLGAALAALVVLALPLALSSCSKEPASSGGGASAAKKGDAIFLAEAPAVVPDELEPELDVMGIGRLYVAGATLSSSGSVTALQPPPPNRIKKPVVFVVMAEAGAEDALNPGAKGELVGEGWGAGLGKSLAEARSWATVTGVHLHLRVGPTHIPALASALKSLKRLVGGLPISVTLPTDLTPEAMKPLSGAVDEVLLFSLGRRPETGDRLVTEPTREAAQAMTIPFRVLIVPGGYGRAGADGLGRRIPDGEIDKLSEDRNLDFDFGEVLSNEAGNVYVFKPRKGSEPSATLLGPDGGSAVFRTMGFGEIVRFVSSASRWGAPKFLGRVFLVDGLPRDGHVVGYPAIRAVLTGKPVAPHLEISVEPRASGKGSVEFVIKASNTTPVPTDLSHLYNSIDIRTEGGVFTAVKAGDFDRFDLLSSEDEKAQRVPFGRATVCRLFENFYAAEETNLTGPIRIVGKDVKVFVKYQLAVSGGEPIRGNEVQVMVNAPEPTPRPKPATRPKKR
ncbi:MAG: hypothetical protein ABIT01_11555 [Thermoanaerobaculia bacterium]